MKFKTKENLNLTQFLNFFISLTLAFFCINTDVGRVSAKVKSETQGNSEKKGTKKMSERQKKFSDMKNHESRIKKYEDELKSIANLKKSKMSVEKRKRLTSRQTKIIKNLRKETKVYRKLKSEFRHKFPEYENENITFFNDKSDEGEAEVEFLDEELDTVFKEELKDPLIEKKVHHHEDQKIIKKEHLHKKTNEEKDLKKREISLKKSHQKKEKHTTQSEKLNQLFPLFHLQMEKTYGLLKNKRFKKLRKTASSKVQEIRKKIEEEKEEKNRKKNLNQSENQSEINSVVEKPKTKSFQGFQRIIFEK